MVLRTAPVPNPPPGTDWSYTVPGQFLENVTGVTAQLATAATLGPMYAVTYDATTGTASFYLDGVPFGTDTQPPAPLAIAPTDLEFGNPATGPATWDEPAFFNSALNAADVAAMFAASTVSYAAYRAAVLARTPVAYYPLDPFPAGGAACADVSGNGNDLTYTVNTGLPPMIAVPGLVAGNNAIQPTGTEIASGPVTGFGVGSFSQVGWVDTLTNPAGLVLGFLQQNPGGNTVWVLQSSDPPGTPMLQLLRVTNLVGPVIQTFNSPNGHWGFNAGTGRQVTLFVTDGNNEVAQIPSGFAEVATPGPYMYSWQTALNSSTQTPNGETTTVAIPKLVLPAGYVIGTRTLDLQAFDQWSNIVVWWDDNIMNALNPISPYVYPPGELLVPRFLRSGP